MDLSGMVTHLGFMPAGRISDRFRPKGRRTRLAQMVGDFFAPLGGLGVAVQVSTFCVARLSSG
jgi:hypothetical protein